MIYLETRINRYDEIEYYLKKIFPELRIFKADLTKEMIGKGFSADNAYVIGLDMSVEEFNDMIDQLEIIDMNEEMGFYEGKPDPYPSHAGWLSCELSDAKMIEEKR